MKRILILLAMMVASAAAQQAAKPADAITIIKAGNLIDPVEGKSVGVAFITVRGNRISSLAVAGSERLSVEDWLKRREAAGAKVIDLSAYTVMPGLIDSHTHLFLQGEDPAEGGYDIQLLKYPLAYRAARATVSARRALEQGFTTIRDVETEGAGYGDVGIRMAVEEGRIPGPRIFASTRGISTTGGYNLEGYAPEIEVPKGVQIIDGPVAARKAAREQIDHGADWIKVYMTHRSWLDDQGNLVSQPTLTVDELKAVVDEAHGWGKKVACHAYNGLGLQRALDGGCDSIEHGLELTDANVAQMVKQGTWYCPTMAPYYYDPGDPNTAAGKRNRKRYEVHGPSLTKAYKAGVKIVFGTDVGGFPWTDPIAQEFDRMVEFGMSPMDSIKAATSNAAEMLGMKGKLGVIAPGAFADVVAVKGDPTKDVKVLREAVFVMKDGAVFKEPPATAAKP